MIGAYIAPHNCSRLQSADYNLAGHRIAQFSKFLREPPIRDKPSIYHIIPAARHPRQRDAFARYSLHLSTHDEQLITPRLRRSLGLRGSRDAQARAQPCLEDDSRDRHNVRQLRRRRRVRAGQGDEGAQLCEEEVRALQGEIVFRGARAPLARFLSWLELRR